MADVKKLAEELVNLKVTEVNELAQILKEEYGIELRSSRRSMALSRLLPLSLSQLPLQVPVRPLPPRNRRSM